MSKRSKTYFGRELLVIRYLILSIRFFSLEMNFTDEILNCYSMVLYRFHFSRKWKNAEIYRLSRNVFCRRTVKNFKRNLENNFQKYRLIVGKIFILRGQNFYLAIAQSSLYMLIQLLPRGNLSFSE